LWLGDIFQPITTLWSARCGATQQRLLVSLLDSRFRTPGHRLALFDVALAQMIIIEPVELRIFERDGFPRTRDRQIFASPRLESSMNRFEKSIATSWLPAFMVAR